MSVVSIRGIFYFQALDIGLDSLMCAAISTEIKQKAQVIYRFYDENICQVHGFLVDPSTKMTVRSTDWPRHFDFSSATNEPNLTKLDKEQVLYCLLHSFSCRSVNKGGYGIQVHDIKPFGPFVALLLYVSFVQCTALFISVSVTFCDFYVILV